MANYISIDEVTNNVTTSTDGNYIVTGEGAFDKLMETINKHMDSQYKLNRLNGPEYAAVYLESITAALSNATQFVLQAKKLSSDLDVVEATLEKQWGYTVTRDTEGNLVLGPSTNGGLIDKQVAEVEAATIRKDEEFVLQAKKLSGDLDITEATLEKQWGYAATRDVEGNLVLGDSTGDGHIDAQIAEVEATTIRKDEESDQMVTEKSEKWEKQKPILDDQVFSSSIDTEYKKENVIADLDQKAGILEQLEADIDFNRSKKDIMEYTRKDNIRIKASEQFSEFLKYMSAAGAMPGTTDFRNIRSLISGIEEGVLDPDAVVSLMHTGDSTFGNKRGLAPYIETYTDSGVYTDANGASCDIDGNLLDADGAVILLYNAVRAEDNGGIEGSLLLDSTSDSNYEKV